MATIAGRATAAGRDERFMSALAGAIFATAVLGFGFHAAMGRVDIPRVPFWVHLHGMANMGWVTLLFAQSLLVRRGSLDLHRRLGWLGAGWIVVVTGLGLTTTALSLVVGRVPPFFSAPFFLMLDGLTILGFAGLATSAIVLRKQTDWHRRLVLGASIVLIAPAWGRILPTPLLGDWIGWGCYPMQALYFVALVWHDLRSRGGVHPATLWGLGTLTVTVALMRPLAFSAPVVALSHALAGG